MKTGTGTDVSLGCNLLAVIQPHQNRSCHAVGFTKGSSCRKSRPKRHAAASNRSDDRCHAVHQNRSDDRCHAVGFTAPTTQRSALVDASAADLAERHGLVMVANRSDDRCHAVDFTAPTTQRSALVDASAADLAERHGLVIVANRSDDRCHAVHQTEAMTDVMRCIKLKR